LYDIAILFNKSQFSSGEKAETISRIRHKIMKVFWVISPPVRLEGCFSIFGYLKALHASQGKLRHMYRHLLLAICMVLGCTAHILARQDIDIEIKPNKPAGPRLTAPTGPKRALTISKGVLFVLTDPPEAEVVVKDSRGVIRARRRSKGGQFREELPGGKYEIEVTAKGYDTFKSKAPVAIKPPEFEVEQAYLTSTSGSIVVGPVRPDATILLNGKSPESAGIRKNIKKEENQIVLEEVPNGFYALRIEQPNYVPVERPGVEVRGGSMTMYTPMFALAMSELEVVSEPGARVYIDNEPMGETNSEGRLKRTDVRVGSRQIQLVKDGYDDYKETYQFEYRKTVLVNHRMTPKATSAGFSEDFGVGLAKWAAPPTGWTRKGGRLEIANSPQLGFAPGYNYDDFIIQFHLKLSNNGGAAWAVRVKDSRNYYLFYLSGPGGMFPKRFNTYVVRDNKFDLQNPINSDAVIHDLTQGSQYTIDISISGNKIENKITPTATGKSETLGIFEDPNNVFTRGSIGFRTVASEVFSIDDIIVQPTKR
jgi:PEGA domain-containing protein